MGSDPDQVARMLVLKGLLPIEELPQGVRRKDAGMLRVGFIIPAVRQKSRRNV